ncbi:MAG: hypothetical protein AB4290_25730, partial [Spirulina sp.]
MMSEPSFQAGQEAFRQGDYETAIAHFQGVCEIELDAQILASARQTLVLAYWRSDRPLEAIAFCRELAQDPEENPWATKTLQDLVQRYRKANAANFVPIEEQRRTGNKQRATGNGQDRQQARPLPTAYQPPSQAAAATVFISGREWRNAERAKTWQRMKAPQQWKFWLRQAIAVLILFWVVRTSLDWTLDLTNDLLVRLPLVRPISVFSQNLTRAILIFFAILPIASPWFLDWILKYFYKLEPLKYSKLAS